MEKDDLSIGSEIVQRHVHTGMPYRYRVAETKFLGGGGSRAVAPTITTSIHSLLRQPSGLHRCLVESVNAI